MKVPGLTPGDIDDYHWLTSDAALPYFARCAEHTGELTRLVASLRKDLSAERAHLVIEQVELRHRAKEKFSRANEMFFTRKGLEQATDEAIANYKAQRMFQVAGHYADICCGIGGDLLAIAKKAERYNTAAIGIDADPVTAHLAMRNVRLASEMTQVRAMPAELLDARSLSVWHSDPDRRVEGKRTSHIDGGEPTRSTIESWLRLRPDGALKLAPAAVFAPDWPVQYEREWIGSRGECRQQLLWFGRLSRHSRAATIVDGALIRTVCDQPAQLSMATIPQRYVAEAHAAVLAADLAPALAAEHRLAALTPEGGYLTGDRPLDHDLALQQFEVQDVLPFDFKQLKSYFRERRIGTLEIKKRGVIEKPEEIRKTLGLQGEHSATLLIARVELRRIIAIVAKRLTGIHHAPP